MPKNNKESLSNFDNNDKIVDLLAENNKYLAEISESLFKIRSYFFWSKLAGFVKFIIILIPLLLAYFYLPPIIESLTLQMKSLLAPLEPLLNLGIN